MRLAAFCCTFLRPHLLGELIESFDRQTYPRELRSLVILDDAGQYPGGLAGDGWRLVSVPERYPTIGAKRNACAVLCPPDAEGLLVADDDDIYLPWWFEAHAAVLKEAEWSRPARWLFDAGAELVSYGPYGTGGGACWAFRRETFEAAGGYDRTALRGEDGFLAGRLLRAGVVPADPCDRFPPFFVRRRGLSYQLSEVPFSTVDELRAGWARLGALPVPPAELRVGWRKEYDKMPVRSATPGEIRTACRGPVSPGS